MRDRLSAIYRFNVDEILLLETVFTYNPSPHRVKIQELANKLAVSERKVYNWFASKRSQSRQETTHPKFFDGKHLRENYDLHLFLMCLHTEHDLL